MRGRGESDRGQRSYRRRLVVRRGYRCRCAAKGARFSSNYGREEKKTHVDRPVVLGYLPIRIDTEVLGIFPLEYDQCELPS